MGNSWWWWCPVSVYCISAYFNSRVESGHLCLLAILLLCLFLLCLLCACTRRVCQQIFQQIVFTKYGDSYILSSKGVIQQDCANEHVTHVQRRGARRVSMQVWWAARWARLKSQPQRQVEGNQNGMFSHFLCFQSLRMTIRNWFENSVDGRVKTKRWLST